MIFFIDRVVAYLGSVIPKSILVVVGCVCVLSTASASSSKGTGETDLLVGSLNESSYDLFGLLISVVQNNPALLSKRAEVEVKNFLLDSANAGRYPSVGLQLGYVKSYYDGGDSIDRALSLRVRQPLWAFGKIDSAIDSAEKAVKTQILEGLALRRDLLDKTVLGYIRVLDIYDRQVIYTQSVATLTTLYHQVNRRFEGGVASKSDVDLASLRLIHAQSDLAKMDGELLLSMNELQSISQTSVSQIEPLSADTYALLVLDRDIEVQAVINSRLIHFKEQLLQQAKSDAEREKTSAMPTLYLQGSVELNDLSSRDGQQVGLMMDASLEGLGFTLLGRSRAASAKRKAVAQNLEMTRQDVIRLVRSLLYTRQSQMVMKTRLAKALLSFDTIIDSYTRLYDAGKKSWLEVLNIQREISTQRLQLSRAKTEWLQATLKLKVMLGDFDRLASS